MSDKILKILKDKFNVIGEEVKPETRYNAFKEDLQFYVLNFIYHHPEYSKWVMYGGSALRIIHGLNRMSVDLDFEIPNMVTGEMLETFKNKIEEHFKNTYGTDTNFLKVKIVNSRGLLLKFNIGDTLSIGHNSKQLHVKIDLNYFVIQKPVIERQPINHDQLSFVIVTYKMSTLMASKLAAIFLRGTRGVGKEIYEEKGRDIYDLLWYMNKKIVPDLDYLMAKGVEVRNPRTLFDKLTIQMNKVSDKNLEQDLSPLFVDKNFIENWLKNWRESYLKLVESYEIHTVIQLVGVGLTFDTNIYSFIYAYSTQEGPEIMIKYRISENFLEDREGELTLDIDEQVVRHMTAEAKAATGKKVTKQKQYATLFYQKTEKYFAKMNRIIVGRSLTTRIIRMDADNLNQKEEIVLNRSALLFAELDNLLK